MRLVIIESPFAGHREGNEQYLNLALRDSLRRGEAPFASHVIYPRVLDDNLGTERAQGIAAGYAWMARADLVAFYIDLGMSPGMEAALARCAREGYPYELRKILEC